MTPTLPLLAPPLPQHQPVRPCELRPNEQRHFANELYKILTDPRNWKRHLRSDGDAPNFRILGAHMATSGFTEVVAEYVALLTPPEPRLDIEHVYAIWLYSFDNGEDALGNPLIGPYDWFLRDMEREGYWHAWMWLLSRSVRKVWYSCQAQPDQYKPEPYMKRNPDVHESAAEASLRLLDYCTILRVDTESADAYLDDMSASKIDANVAFRILENVSV